MYTDNNKKSDHNDHSDAGNVQISPRINTGFDSSLVRDRKSYNDQVLQNVQKIRDNINKVLSMNSKKRKVEIQDDSSDEFPIREPGKTQAIKPVKSYWQHIPVTEKQLVLKEHRSTIYHREKWFHMAYRGQFAPIYNWTDLVAMKKYGTRTI